MNKVNVIKQNLEFIGKTWIKYIGTFASILSLFFLFWTWDDIRITSTQYKCVIIILLCVLALILAILWTCIFKRTKTIWESPSGKIKVCYSDIMKDGFDKRNKEEKLFVIPVNSCFDTIVDEDISTCSKPLVSPNSLHGRWIKTMVNKGFTIEEIDNKIHNCLEMQNLVPKSIIADEDKERGKREVYELGTVAMIRGNNNSTFLLLAISEYDKDNIAHTSVDDLEMCIKSLLNFYDQHGQGHRLVIPLMGTNLSSYKVQGKNGPSNWSSLEASAKEAKLGYTLVASTPTFNLYDQFNAYVLGQTSLSEVTGTQVAKANKEITDAQ